MILSHPNISVLNPIYVVGKEVIDHS